MRRLLLSSATALLAVGAFALPAGAAPAAATPPRLVCTIDSERLPEVTGFTSVPGGFVGVTAKPLALRLWKLDSTCQPKSMTKVVDDPNIEPISIQDLARTPDGVLWVGDIGDIEQVRDTISISKVVPGARKAIKYRLTYPDGRHNAAALLVAPGGIPYIFSRETKGRSKVYTTGAPLSAATTPLKAAGAFTVPASTTPGGKFGKFSQSLVSGAALSPDGKRFVVRTLTDAYEWDIDTDIATTLASGKAPRVTPLPNEGSGESITYTSDGADFVTADSSAPSKVLEYAPAPLPAPSAVAKAAVTTSAGTGGSFFSDLTFNQLSGLIIGVGVVGLLLLLGGIFGIVRFRRQQRDADEPSLDAQLAESRARPEYGEQQGMAPMSDAMGAPRGAGGPATALLTAEPAARGGTVYGGQPQRGGTVYGAPAQPVAEPQQRGTVYGGGGGTTYGSGAPGGRAGTTYGAPGSAAPAPSAPAGPPPAAPPRGTTYGGAPNGAAPGARPGQVYGRPPTPPPPTAQGQRPAGSVYGGGNAYGGPPADVDGRANRDAIQELPPRSPRDWRSRRPPD